MKINQLTEIFQNRSKIWEGLKNRIFKQEHIEEIYRQRIEICRSNECGFYDKDGTSEVTVIKGSEACGNCGCSLSLKLRVLSENCPINKWIAIVSEQEEEMIKDQISKDEAKNSGK